MIKYFGENKLEKFLLIGLGLVLDRTFKILGLRFFIGIGILAVSWLVIKFIQKNVYKGRFKIHHKDIYK
ncbi:hypothetical protein [Clostridium mediterraneense]|uniref:hypothetical protein n=1 Tax=Clostridium mediterraneense TaxID=1805472 RepID=UPI00083450E9|nr:hypothetical protein [Clostridium mediterraneense]